MRETETIFITSLTEQVRSPSEHMLHEKIVFFAFTCKCSYILSVRSNYLAAAALSIYNGLILDSILIVYMRVGCTFSNGSSLEGCCNPYVSINVLPIRYRKENLRQRR